MTNNMIFFDANYAENYATITGNFFPTSNAQFLFDNDSNAVCTWSANTSGSVVIDLGQTLTIGQWIIANHNFLTGKLYILDSLTGTYSLVSSFVATAAENTHYIDSTHTTRFFAVVFSTTISNEKGFCGQIIATNKKFQLNHNPNIFEPEIVFVGNNNTLYDGRLVRNEIADYYQAQIGWDYCIGDLNSMTGTDLQNMTELARQKSSFLFWANANNTSTAFPDITTWRKQDIYKCKIVDNVSYVPAIDGRIDIMSVDYLIREVK